MTKDGGDTEITLGVLNAVEKNSNITQRDVSKNINRNEDIMCSIFGVLEIKGSPDKLRSLLIGL